MEIVKKIGTECDRLVDMMMARGIAKPSAAVKIESGRGDVCVVLNYAKDGDNCALLFEFLSGETVDQAVCKAKAWIEAQPTPEELAIQEAIKLTANALEASRKAGLDTGDGAAFVAQLEGMIKNLSKNAITKSKESI